MCPRVVLSCCEKKNPARAKLNPSTVFVRVLEILESPGILFWHFSGMESPEKLMHVLESPGNL